MKNSRVHLTAVLGAVALSITLVASPATAASTSSQGGDGSPAGCSNAYNVKTAPIHGQRGVTAGKEIGVLELRYSAACRANWSRVTLYRQSFSSPITIEQELNTEGRWTTTSDYGLSVKDQAVSAYGRYIRLGNVNSTACVQAWISSDFGTLNYHTVGTRLCA